MADLLYLPIPGARSLLRGVWTFAIYKNTREVIFESFDENSNGLENLTLIYEQRKDKLQHNYKIFDNL